MDPQGCGGACCMGLRLDTMHDKPSPCKLTQAEVDSVVEALARIGHMSHNPDFMARVTLDVLKELDK